MLESRALTNNYQDTLHADNPRRRQSHRMPMRCPQQSAPFTMHLQILVAKALPEDITVQYPPPQQRQPRAQAHSTKISRDRDLRSERFFFFRGERGREEGELNTVRCPKSRTGVLLPLSHSAQLISKVASVTTCYDYARHTSPIHKVGDASYRGDRAREGAFIILHRNLRSTSTACCCCDLIFLRRLRNLPGWNLDFFCEK